MTMKHDKIVIKTYVEAQPELPQMHGTIIDDLCALAACLGLFGVGLYHYGGVGI